MSVRISKLLAWAFSRQGAHDLAAVAAAVGVVYETLHKAGVL